MNNKIASALISTIVVFTSSMLVPTSVSAQQKWSPAGDYIKTRWAEDVDPSCPHPEYPRPQLVRSEWLNLNGLWDYSIVPSAEDYSAPQGSILVPFCLESSLSGVGCKLGKDNALWYERSFAVPSKWKGKRVRLNFDAVDWSAEVWVNGQKVGSHTGGYASFSFDITPYLKKSGRQNLRVKVLDATDNSYQPRGKQVDTPGGIWYTSVTGIWQSVWLEPVASTSVDYCCASLDKDGVLQITAGTTGLQEGDEVLASLKEGAIAYSAEHPSSAVLATAAMTSSSSAALVPGAVSCGIKLENARLWSSGDPWLYGLQIEVRRAGKLLDKVESYAALRSVGTEMDPKPDRNVNSYKRFAVNGKRTFMFGPLDQGWWPDGLYTAPTDEALRYDVEQTRAWGWNMIRKHIKIEPARWYYWCDVNGIMVWQDMPIVGDHSNRKGPETRDEDVRKNTHNQWASDSFIGGTDALIPSEWKDNFLKEWKEIMIQLMPFQSIVVWVPFNEAWGQFDTPEVVAFTRSVDDSRLVNESSGGNYSFSGDIVDTHHYAAPAMNAFESSKVNVIGEFGGLGMPISGHLWQEDRNFGYGKNLDGGAQVLEIYRSFTDMLKIFTYTGCSGAVYTQTTDVESEVNGIMTYDRKITKIDPGAFRELNQSVINNL